MRLQQCVIFCFSLEWELDGFQDDLKEARENLEGMIADSDLLMITPSYGKRIPKKCRLSPDGWFQVRILCFTFLLYLAPPSTTDGYAGGLLPTAPEVCAHL